MSGRADRMRAVALRAGAGDAAALRELIVATSTGVWRVCAALVDAAAAEDLVQETYVRAIRALPGYRAESAPFPWLATIARRVCADEVGQRQRARAMHTRLPVDLPAASGDPVWASDLRDAVARLPAERREALLLTAVAGLSYAEAAEVCGCAVGTIRSRVARARAALGTMLGRRSDGADDGRDATG